MLEKAEVQGPRPLARAREFDWRRNLKFVLAAMSLITLHGALTQHFLPWSAAFTTVPLQGGDFDVHLGQTLRVLEGIDGWGRSWVYDVQLLAGQPEGTIFDADNKGWEWWTFVLWKLGLSKAAAFNSFVWFGMAACPLLVFASALLLELSLAGALLSAALASSIFFFDSFAHWVFWIGMNSYALAAYFALLPLGLFYRLIERRSLWAGVLCAPALGLAHLIHPYTFFILALPLSLLTLQARRRLTRAQIAVVVLIVLTTLGLNAGWLGNALSHWHYILDSAYYGQTGLDYLLADVLNILRGPSDTGVIGTRASFRFLYLGLALGGLMVLRARRSPLTWPLASAMGFLLLLAYAGEHVPGATQLQPYRHVLPLAYLACVLAPVFLSYAWPALRALPARGKALCAVLAFVAAQQLVTDALYYFPQAVPEEEALIDGQPSPLTRYGYFRSFSDHTHIEYRLPYEPWVEAFGEQVVSWVQKNVRHGERVLVDNGVIGERLAWKTGVEVLGGFRERNLAHAYANFFRRFERDGVAPEVIEKYMRTFGVRWVILATPRDDFKRANKLLRPTATVAGRVIYRGLLDVSQVLQGGGKVRASTNRLEVSGSDPEQDVVLSYHFHEKLRCHPDCTLRREQVELDDVGLIRVPAPHPADFTIENDY